ncbi:HoxN/HupN/NixA family nickel/cobalt transporter [Trinickia sp.]|uniref:HoxN/HupN/NixA family nickel/cobalt transporter n=1 Tax=Trinickia sp. TaxID=2571163 RepID=UPI003F81B16D
MRRHIAGLYGLLFIFNIAVWAWAFAALGSVPTLMGMAVLAYSFGVRHALDADHIAAIDNVTRKMMHAGKRPLTIGLMFSLGHSTVVVLATAFIATAAAELNSRIDLFKTIGAVVGGLFSSFFLLTIAMTNLRVLLSVSRTYARLRGAKGASHPDRLEQFATRGPLSRLLAPALGRTTKSWHMYLLGFLFGLGFDTATEVGLLGLSAGRVAHGMPLADALIFPSLFTAGMTLVDTTDGLLMIGAYGWALVDFRRKLRYDMTVTALSVGIAVVVGSVEAMRLLGDSLDLTGGVWQSVRRVSDDSSLTGAAIVCLFALVWGGAAMRGRRRRTKVRLG